MIVDMVYLSKTGADAKKMFTDKVVPISINYPFFFKPIQDGMDRPKTELAYRVPASKFTRKKLQQTKIRRVTRIRYNYRLEEYR